jgi:hypothetical protein
MISERFRKYEERGRPPVISEEELREVQRARRRPLSRRALQDAVYALRAVSVLKLALSEPERFDVEELGALLWLGDPDRPESWRNTHLTALGRVRDPVDLIAAALVLAERRPTADEARAMVRRMGGTGGGRTPEPRPPRPAPWERRS